MLPIILVEKDDGDLADKANREVAAGMEARLAEIRSEVQAYGTVPPDGPRICIECGELISAARLRAIPNAILCKDCKEGQELPH